VTSLDLLPEILAVLKEGLNDSIADGIGLEFRNPVEVISSQMTFSGFVQTLESIPQTIDLSL
jgi:hypothetical protein